MKNNKKTIFDLEEKKENKIPNLGLPLIKYEDDILIFKTKPELELCEHLLSTKPRYLKVKRLINKIEFQYVRLSIDICAICNIKRELIKTDLNEDEQNGYNSII